MSLRKVFRSRKGTGILAGATVVAVTAGLVVVGGTSASAAAGCRVDYTITNQWDTGFGANVTITNLGDAVSGWTLQWDFAAGQSVDSGWGGSFAQSGSTVTVSNAAWNGSIGTGASVTPGFNGKWSGSNPTPSSFKLNGVACTGSTTGTSTSTSTSTTTATTTTSSSTTTTTTTDNQNPPSGLAGWATQNGGTTGGGSSSSVSVGNSSALASAVSGTNASVVRVTSSFSCSGMIKVGSNKTILGASGVTISGCGLTLSGSKNVIIRNLSFSGWDDDAINVESGSTNVWIDHNSFTNGYDGAVDIKRASDFITVSWNRVYNHGKSMLLGHSDGNGSQDTGHLRVTYHHNYFDGSGTRHPRVRFGNPVHVFNNYYRDNEYGVASTMDAGVLVEGNYFENVDEPTLVGYADSDPGTLVQRNNYFVGSGSPESAGSVASIPYSYSVDSASGVKSTVVNGAGAGKISV
ncbi:pectate lyase [Saccharothrix texasensis]|uniref:Pectate lyase n=2 Tax=Saccharothrix texasensis TaxID=103734 RepID=A0A3N1HH13_9PSEU|nr:pectate lyase [Saccharothrix texasensis]